MAVWPTNRAIEAWEDAQSHQDTKYYYGAAKHPGQVTKTVYPDSGEVTVAYNDDGADRVAVRQGEGRQPPTGGNLVTRFTYAPGYIDALAERKGPAPLRRLPGIV